MAAFDYRYDGKRKTLSMGTYPETGLADARERRDAARKQVQAGIEPGAHRKAEKAADADRAANGFAVIAEEWLPKQAGKMAPTTYEKTHWPFDTLVNPWIGNRPITEIDAQEMLKLLQRTEKRGAREMGRFLPKDPNDLEASQQGETAAMIKHLREQAGVGSARETFAACKPGKSGIRRTVIQADANEARVAATQSCLSSAERIFRHDASSLNCFETSTMILWTSSGPIIWQGTLKAAFSLFVVKES